MTKEMWRHFCRHVVDIENKYIDEDGIVEDTLEEMTIEIGGEDDDSDVDGNGDNDLIDDMDRQVIDRAIRQTDTSTDTEQSTSTGSHTNTDICTHPRRDLTHQFAQHDPEFLDSILPLP